MTTVEPTAVAHASKSMDRRWWIVVGFYVATAVSGFTDALSENGLVYYLSALLLASTAAGWCVADANRRSKPMPWGLQLLAFLLWPAFVLLYLIYSRGWRGLGWTVLNIIGISAVHFLAQIVAIYLYWGPAAFQS